MINFFPPGTQANFKFRKESVTSRIPSAVYAYEVAKANSTGRIHDDTSHKSVEPAYRGAVWIDTSTARVLRIEMEAVDMPDDFPTDHVETAVDYDYVNLGPERYLLPVHSESILCQRGTPYCSRNVIEWRNYHKYQGESKIIFDAPKDKE